MMIMIMMIMIMIMIMIIIIIEESQLIRANEVVAILCQSGHVP